LSVPFRPHGHLQPAAESQLVSSAFGQHWHFIAPGKPMQNGICERDVTILPPSPRDINIKRLHDLDADWSRQFQDLGLSL
jgi:hypothetical protein